jgi:hypothetical protein
MCGKIPNFHIHDGTDEDMEYMLGMRDNLLHYVNLIDIYAPCIVGRSNWHKHANLNNQCGESSALFNDFVFSVSDEAFLLLVLLNYTATWISELKVHRQTVR